MNFITDHQKQTQPTTGFVLIRTYQAGIVARNRCCDRNQAGLTAYEVKLPFVVKSEKINTG